MAFELCFSIIPEVISKTSAALYCNLCLPFCPSGAIHSSLPEFHVSTFSLCPFLSGVRASSRSWEGVGSGWLWLRQLQEQLGFLRPQAALRLPRALPVWCPAAAKRVPEFQIFQISPYYGLKNSIFSRLTTSLLRRMSREC